MIRFSIRANENMDDVKYKRVLVTGSAGFMGSHLVDYLLAKGFKVYGVDDLSGGYLRNVNKKSHFTKLDLRDKKKTRGYINKIKPDLIYHLAADATEGRSQFTPLGCTERNYLAYLNLLVPAIRNRVKRIVLTSSMAVYGVQKPPFHEGLPRRPEDLYAISKTAMEEAAEVLSSVHGFEYVIVRPHNVYGERQNIADPYRNVIGIFINSLLAGKPFYIYGDGKQKRSFSYVDDCTAPLAKCGLIKNLNGEIINLGPGPETAVTINKLANTVLKEFFGTDNVPKKMRPIYLSARPREVKNAFSTCDKAKKLLGFKPKTSLEEGIRKMIKWARKLGHQKPKYLDEIELPTKNMPKTWKKKLI